MERYKNVAKDILVERAKELECLYLIDEALASNNFPAVMQKTAEIIPIGFRNMDSCIVTIELDNQVYRSKPAVDNCNEIQTIIQVNDSNRGCIKVAYPPHTFSKDDRIFLDQEVKLIQTIASRISEYLIRKTVEETGGYRNKWQTIIDLLQNTDNDTLLYICSRTMSLVLRIKPDLLSKVYAEMGWEDEIYKGETNSPLEMLPDIDVIKLSNVLFSTVSSCMDDEKIYKNINLWIYQGKTYEIARIINKKNADIRSILKALKKYIKNVKTGVGSSEATDRWLKVELVRRFLTENPHSITSAQKHISIEAFYELLKSFISSPSGIGKIGGKGTGLFIAHQIIEANKENNANLCDIKVPRTWYISSEELISLIDNNGLDELHEHKYKDIVEIRATYPRIIQILKNLKFSSYINDALSEILDSCSDRPLIVRSSSLLEDQVGTSFSGKYKSLFIPNTGTKAERHQQLVEGILEVYASVYNPDSIQYRKKRDLLDYSERMGILIQEVVGNKIGPYYFPLYAGMAFSFNELRWSPRINRENGLLRLVMGLGTRAVDRVGDDYPILISPGQPGLRVNQTPEEIRKYSPQMIDAIDMEKKEFVTLPVKQLLKVYGDKINHIDSVVSTFKNDVITEANIYTSDFQNDEFVVTFDGLFKRTPLLAKLKSTLSVLQEKLGYPVDIEFASDGDNLYLLQCRPQSRNKDNTPAAIPANIAHNDIIFTAGKHVSNGQVTNIKTVVYVDPVKYTKMTRHKDYLRVGNAVSEINRLMPRRSFILMGPGRWGSRGDIKLGVPVTYSDINNTSMIIEIASRESKYQPELSFGTHFFQDLVEENIRYLPLYPDDKNVIFNKSFFNNSKNSLSSVTPDFADLDHVIKVIKVDEIYYGKNLHVLMNADLGKAIAFLNQPAENESIYDNTVNIGYEQINSEEGWRWRHYMAEKIAEQIDMETFSVKGIYLIGSTNNCTAKMSSDIDLLIHIDATQEQKDKLDSWLKGWSLALSEINYLKTGYKTDGLLDIHYVTDHDIQEKTSFAIKINSIYDPAHPLRIRPNSF